jgi:type II secretory pathway component PulF
MDTLYKSSDNQAIKMVAKQLEYYVRQGKPLSYGISRLPEYFDEGDAAIIKTGETSGNLPTVLSSLAEEYAYIDEIKQKYIGAMIYPCSLIVISVAAVIYLFASVLPGIFGTIMSANVEPPTVTKILKDISDFFVNYWKIML